MEEKSQEEMIVDDHRKMLLMSGNISDFQLENLKKWPFLVFDKNINKVEINYDFKLDQPDEEKVTDIKAGSVEFDFYFNMEPPKDETQTAFAMLEFWTKYLFWKDTEVSFKIQGNKWEA